MLVQNIDRTVNVGKVITYQIECNMFFKGYIERAQMDVCNLGKTEVILGIPWLTAHNLEINWEKEEVKITVSTNIWKEKTENTGEETGEKNRERKDSRGISI